MTTLITWPDGTQQTVRLPYLPTRLAVLDAVAQAGGHRADGTLGEADLEAQVLTQVSALGVLLGRVGRPSPLTLAQLTDTGDRVLGELLSEGWTLERVLQWSSVAVAEIQRSIPTRQAVAEALVPTTPQGASSTPT